MRSNLMSCELSKSNNMNYKKRNESELRRIPPIGLYFSRLLYENKICKPCNLSTCFNFYSFLLFQNEPFTIPCFIHSFNCFSILQLASNSLFQSEINYRTINLRHNCSLLVLMMIFPSYKGSNDLF